ncbi:uncharacterized protein L969DRAFT_89212 [Mixia osmundae IAM 14324]|uniref:F-box domain-containing protein n=1 Tax=Mixia osmundae (strain CBS 9802 / IAM 14324 / JCM 22182 / KY 12970) TaxID=764103 RepID=G7DSH0_MIXOS|nr:uncharacterized protein L969DRAFT_89212 [Mixia osmundae IAM 14324]KEI37974.1 hypothetical protein L969DRAFT_89212 [Mixia osmundae IAM 14324]GAA93530.1 hypothetical protein E5Q_00172 [Mixia osmundae IAM 14324]
MGAIDQLPTELLIEIIKRLGNGTNQYTHYDRQRELVRLSQVSRLWAAVIQPLLLSDVLVRNFGRAQALLRTLRANDHLQPLFTGLAWPGQLSAGPAPPEAPRIYGELLALTSDHLRTLRISSFLFDLDASTIFSASQICLGTLRTLHIEIVVLYGDEDLLFLTFLSNLTCLEDLSIKEVDRILHPIGMLPKPRYTLRRFRHSSRFARERDPEFRMHYFTADLLLWYLGASTEAGSLQSLSLVNYDGYDILPPLPQHPTPFASLDELHIHIRCDDPVVLTSWILSVPNVRHLVVSVDVWTNGGGGVRLTPWPSLYGQAAAIEISRLHHLQELTLIESSTIDALCKQPEWLTQGCSSLKSVTFHTHKATLESVTGIASAFKREGVRVNIRPSWSDHLR